MLIELRVSLCLCFEGKKATVSLKTLVCTKKAGGWYSESREIVEDRDSTENLNI